MPISNALYTAHVCSTVYILLRSSFRPFFFLPSSLRNSYLLLLILSYVAPNPPSLPTRRERGADIAHSNSHNTAHVARRSASKRECRSRFSVLHPRETAREKSCCGCVARVRCDSGSRLLGARRRRRMSPRGPRRPPTPPPTSHLASLLTFALLVYLIKQPLRSCLGAARGLPQIGVLEREQSKWLRELYSHPELGLVVLNHRANEAVELGLGRQPNSLHLCPLGLECSMEHSRR